MNIIKLVMRDEWRYWRRTRVATTVVLIGLVLSLASVVINAVEMRQASAERAELQKVSEANFLDQPDRHPHRMVHYGHYVFRAPSPLSIIDPGVDAYTGTAIFLEGHQQNSAMFADQRQSSGMTRFSSLSPAFMLQVIVPLLLILVGYSCITREKEAGTLHVLITQGVKARHILGGKFLSLFGSGLLMLAPLILASLWAVLNGESFLISASFILGYTIYILIWSAIVLWVSTISSRSNASFAILIGLWVILCILVPRIGSSTAATFVSSPSKLETDFAVREELRALGDGHNASDPAFEKLKQDLLDQYGVDDISELPLNFRGVVATYSEKKLTDVLNKYADNRMDEELAQAKIAREFGWLSPMVSIRTFSMMISGTNLETHHRFLREAENLRFDFVQALNHVHAHDLDYDADVNRYKNDETAIAARVDASHWDVLSDFSFEPESSGFRLDHSLHYSLQLLFWFGLMLLLIKKASRRIL
ncbi:ABC transporter permease [Vibrio comitans]|uniref:ABC transporter permease n=1 Tax=Vibrio comitans NBRC 102076 TaxID=1219078 RepID=A0A4Y3IIA7_9VIBR|nr:DUF3526 domain-containing protein [Vibrio comitans]GEA59141.1 ABC transporter permease [Vibrio comitans NBRC 102076]